MKTVTVQTIEVTPELAALWLSKNSNNRNLNKTHVSKLSTAMRDGSWKFNGDPVRFNGDNLIDGQHRLAAIIATNQPQTMLVVQGLDSDVFDTIDKGKKRSVGDTLFVRGEKNTILLAAASNIIIAYERDTLKYRATGGIGRSYLDYEVIDCIERHPTIRDAVSLVTKSRAVQDLRLIRGALCSGLYCLFSEINKEKANDFLNHLNNGGIFSVDSPVGQLREMLLKFSSKRSVYPDSYIAALVIKAWNYYINNKAVSVLRFAKDEAFPVISKGNPSYEI